MLYSTYRPQTLQEVSGQEENVATLQEQIRARAYGQAYLFAGHRGTGKTTIARILARAICCKNSTGDGPCNQCENCKAILKNTTLDCIELDAASHNSISDIKELVSSTMYAPVLLPKKIYIIDEVHNLSGSAFDALLKTVEEPPGHCVFILCTTELHKIPATIRSRCSIYQFRALMPDVIHRRLAHVFGDLGKTCEPEALGLIARQAEGSLRDALSIAEKLMVTCDTLTTEHVKKALCLTDDEASLTILDAVSRSDGKEAIRLLQETYEEGKNLPHLVDSLIQCLADGIVLISSSKEARLYNTEEYQERLSHLLEPCPLELLFWYMDQLSQLKSRIRNSLNPYMEILICLMKCCSPPLADHGTAALLKRICALEQTIAKMEPCPEKACSVCPPEPDAPAEDSSEASEEEPGISASRLAPAPDRQEKPCKGESTMDSSGTDTDGSETENAYDEDEILGMLSDYL